MLKLKYAPFSCLGIRMHACLLKAKEVGGTRFKAEHLHIPNIRITAYMITGKSRKSCLLNKAKTRKECNALISSKT